MRYVCYAIIHDIFMLMHLMLFAKHLTYIFKIKIRKPIQGALEESYKEKVGFMAQGPYDVL